ncbi:MAG TPA: diguanylate cyclase [Terriglobia bacterium]|nr:diguanylate cyclase [Terriglobia bacterium]
MPGIRVLVAEDDPVSLRLVETKLKKWGYQVVPARDGTAAMEALSGDDPPQLAILDWMMPRKDGLTVCRELRAQAERPYIYILLLTAKTQQKDLLEGLGAGADDYLTKPFSSDELKARLFAGERILGFQRQLVEAREALRAQAIRDVLTGLFNRRYLEEALARELRRAAHGSTPLTVLMFDLDHFKNFNDTHGHGAGDDLLKHLGALIEARTRRGDVSCRYGGEEFVLIMPGATADVGRRRGDDFRQVICEARVEHQGKPLGPISVSVGVASFPEHGTTPAELLQAADDALYRAKAAGRNCVVVHNPATPAAPAPGAAPAAE